MVLLFKGCNYITKRKKIQVSNNVAAVASFVLALASLVAMIYHIQVLLPLLHDGKRAEAIVTGFHRGARNSKWAIYRFETVGGEPVTQRDRFQLYIIRPQKGEQVTVIYNPDDTSLVTADLGIWVWQGPIIFLLGFVILTATGILILQFKPGQSEKQD
ncbi:MAG TPA: DUF3592 domain-containing protein [Gammaproteobacteria bacterium]|nr:DUF3592 domain-containing protein [Gammaproteobacteria bacterium]